MVKLLIVNLPEQRYFGKQNAGKKSDFETSIRAALEVATFIRRLSIEQIENK